MNESAFLMRCDVARQIRTPKTFIFVEKFWLQKAPKNGCRRDVGLKSYYCTYCIHVETRNINWGIRANLHLTGHT
jgi:hypothetical protein